MTNELTIAQPLEVSPAQQEAWLGMAKAKNELVTKLQQMELQAQSILIKVRESDAYEAIDVATAAYRKLHSEIVETRKPLTNAIDTGIVQPLMQFEKRVDPKSNEDYNALIEKSLSLRKAEADKAAKVNQKNAEVTRFKTHVDNEFFRVAAEYRGLLRREILGQYKIELESGTAPDTAHIKAALRALAIPPINKFQTAILSNEEMLEIYTGVAKPDYLNIYNEMMKECDEVFANYESDKVNVMAAIDFHEEQNKLADIEAAKKLAEEQAMNILIATSETVVIDEPKIKKTLQVTVVESEMWAKSVIAAFIVNLPHLTKYIRVKSWSKLNVGQMATYLGQLASDTGTMSDKLQYREVEK